MSLLPKIRTQYGEGIGVELYFAFPELQADQRSYLDADSAIGDSTLSANGINFSVSQYIVIGFAGDLKTELIQLHAATTPTATLITLVSALSFPHNRGDIIRFIPYNQIVPERSTDSGSTFTQLATVNIRADSSETYLQRASDASTDVYRFRFFNSNTGNYSAYSSNVTASGYADNTIASVKARALAQLGEVRNNLITDQFLNDGIQEARRKLDQNPAALRYSFRTKFGQVVGQILAGQNSISAPSDMRDRNTYKNLLSLRIGDQNRPCVYQDRRRFNQNYLNVQHSITSGSTSSGSTTLVLSSTKDFPTAGTVRIANNAYNDGLISVTYTGNNRSTNTLSGCSGINRTVTTGTDVWRNATFGLPAAYTIDNGTILFDIPIGTSFDGMDAKADYYSIIPVISSDSQTFDEPFYDFYVSYLKWKIKYQKANGKLDRQSDPDWIDFMEGVTSVIGQETTGQRTNFVPDIEGFLSAQE